MSNVAKKSGITVLDDDEYQKAIAEPSGVLICMIGECSVFKDSIVGKCDICGCKIHYRPYNKDASHKICVDCADKTYCDKNVEN